MKNVGRLDQQVRYGVGALFVLYGILAFVVTWPFAVGATVAGIALLATARMRFCGLYRLIGVNTCPIDERK